VVCPLLQMDAASLICISTVRGGQNFFSAFLHMKNERGEPVFDCVTMKLVCDRPACIAAPDTCSHMMAAIPKWQSVRAHKRVKALMTGEDALRNQEMYGMENEQHESAFSQLDVAHVFDKSKFYVPSLLEQRRIRHVFLGVDPNANGPSDQAMVALFDLPDGGGFCVRFFQLHLCAEERVERGTRLQNLHEQREKAIEVDLARGKEGLGGGERLEEGLALVEFDGAPVLLGVRDVLFHRRRDVQEDEEGEQHHRSALARL